MSRCLPAAAAQAALWRWENEGGAEAPEQAVGRADPQWNDKQDEHPSTVVFTVQPVGWVGEWHENPAPQWIVVLSGRWFIESMDGTRVEQGPGDFSSARTRDASSAEARRGIAQAR